MDKFLTDDHKQIFLGSLLGNGFICKGTKNKFFCMKHSLKHFAWIQSKAYELTDYATKKPWSVYGTSVAWKTVTNPLFNYLYSICYKDKKKTISMDWLNQLRSIAIAVWYGDSGNLIGRNRKNACLRTQSFGKYGNQIIERYFNEVGVPCGINRWKDKYVILFTVKGTEILLSKLVAPYLPKNRHFKLI